ncbi:hypothetical protein [Ruminococcus sp. HUN007]|uniref:hypothetical protein n=1 Tax=Ruminococcus sp. HUN007 TaxID=1514668 RepID=UPI0005D151EA|nr:hypothetical protein [Ruminococcus sp. HUN007]
MKLNNFEVKFGKDDELRHIADLKDAINKVTSTNYKFIEDLIDVPSWLIADFMIKRNEYIHSKLGF